MFIRANTVVSMEQTYSEAVVQKIKCFTNKVHTGKFV